MRKFFFAAAVAVASLFGSASSADAGFTLTLKVGATTQNYNLTSGTLNNVGPVSIGGYTVSVTADDSAPGVNTTFGGALISQNTFSVTAANPTDALIITVEDDTFSSAPYGSGNSVTVVNSLSTTLITSGSVTANGFIIGGSTLTTTDIALAGPALSGAVSNSISGSITPLGATFTLGNMATVNFSGGGSQQANFTVTTLVPVPAPAGIVLALTTLPALGIGGWLRRRRQTA